MEYSFLGYIFIGGLIFTLYNLILDLDFILLDLKRSYYRNVYIVYLNNLRSDIYYITNNPKDIYKNISDDELDNKIIVIYQDNKELKVISGKGSKKQLKDYLNIFKQLKDKIKNR